jgi:ABC-2 type transport system ATP-binding protein
MKRRMMIAKALVHRPKLLLLDEPTAGVDVELRTQLWNFVRSLREEGVSVVLTTHYLEEAQMLCDRVGIINHGELKYIGETQSIIKELTQKKVSVRLTNGQTWNLTLQANDELGKILQEKGIETRDIADIQARDGTLEEAFLKLTGEESRLDDKHLFGENGG